MKLREKLAKGAEPYLEPGERVQAAFLAATGAETLNEGGVAADRAVVVTDRRILLCSTDDWARVDGHLADVARTTVIGPPEGWFHFWTDALGPELLINRRFYADVKKADELLLV